MSVASKESVFPAFMSFQKASPLTNQPATFWRLVFSLPNSNRRSRWSRSNSPVNCVEYIAQKNLSVPHYNRWVTRLKQCATCRPFHPAACAYPVGFSQVGINTGFTLNIFWKRVFVLEEQLAALEVDCRFAKHGNGRAVMGIDNA